MELNRNTTKCYIFYDNPKCIGFFEINFNQNKHTHGMYKGVLVEWNVEEAGLMLKCTGRINWLVERSESRFLSVVVVLLVVT